MTIEIKKLTPHIGAEVLGARIGPDLTDDDFAVIKQAKGHHGAGRIADGTSHLTAPQAASARSMSASPSLDWYPPSPSSRLAASSALAAAVRIARSSDLRILSQDAM